MRGRGKHMPVGQPYLYHLVKVMLPLSLDGSFGCEQSISSSGTSSDQR